MPCYHPIGAFQRRAGAPLLFGSGFRVGDRHLNVPCGQCVGCRLEFSRQWAVRCVHEAQMHAESCMLTLTYDAAHLPSDLSLDHRHFQLFMKRLRIQGFKVRYYMCGEYGEINSRPHYHCCLFGFYPTDRVYFRTSDAGFKCYTSKFLDDVWQLGSVFVGDVSLESAGYVARYVLKKVGSDGAMREIFDPSTGEIIKRAHEYGRMSRRPGIGASWYAKFRSDVFPHDRVVLSGARCRVPRYYDVLLDRESPLYMAEIKALRAARADKEHLRKEKLAGSALVDVDRYDVHEAVKLASIRFLSRS